MSELHDIYAEGEGDENWITVKSWGDWELQISPDCSGMVLEGPNDYWIGDDRWSESDWYDHLSRKSWNATYGLADALEFVRSLTPTRKRQILKAALTLKTV